MGKGKKQRMQEKKQAEKLENEHLEDIKDSESDEDTSEITPERQAFIDYGFDKLEKHELNQIIRETEDMDEIIALTACKDETIRLNAVKEMCPCHVKADKPEFWDAILKLGKPQPHFHVISGLARFLLDYQNSMVFCLTVI